MAIDYCGCERAVPNYIQYWHLKLVKRGGQGHDPSSVKGTKDGEVGVECPSCLHPGKNLPSHWEDAPPESK